MPSPTDLHRAVARVVARLAPGDVASYGEVARMAGRPGAARRVGSVLRDADGLPWWRVVHADGRLISGQADRLRAEGVPCRDGHLAGPRSPRRAGIRRA